MAEANKTLASARDAVQKTRVARGFCPKNKGKGERYKGEGKGYWSEYEPAYETYAFKGKGESESRGETTERGCVIRGDRNRWWRACPDRNCTALAP